MLAQDIIGKYHSLEGLNNRNLSPGSGVWLSKISMPVESKAGDSPVLKA